MSAQVVHFDVAAQRCQSAQEPSCRYVRGFTLVDVLVTMAVVGVLIALLLPSLAAVRETAHQIVCRSNVRQLAIGTAMYADANAEAIPRTVTVLSGTIGGTQSLETLTLRFGTQAVPSFQGIGWDGMGLLYVHEYLPAPKVFYCPSHRGSRPYRDFINAWSTEDESIAGNFQYRGQGPTGRSSASGQPIMSTRLDKIKPSSSLIADGLRSLADFNHLIGANVMRADISVSWYNDSSGNVSNALAKEDQSPSEAQILGAWNELDQPPNR